VYISHFLSWPFFISVPTPSGYLVQTMSGKDNGSDGQRRPISGMEELPGEFSVVVVDFVSLIVTPLSMRWVVQIFILL
jgi:hypothetical protein